MFGGRVWGLGCRVQGLGFLYGLGCGGFEVPPDTSSAGFLQSSLTHF